MSNRFFFIFFVLLQYQVAGQIKNPILPAANFLTLIPDAAAAGSGMTGVATIPSGAAIYWNPAKIAFLPYEYGCEAGYVPYLRSVAKGMGMANFSGYKKLTEEISLGINIRYFTLGEVQFIDEAGYDVYAYSPNEYTAGLTFSQRLSDYTSIGLSARYIRSQPSLGMSLGGQAVTAANAIGADVGYYYSSIPIQDLYESDYHGNSYRFGVVLQNIGSKISYLSTQKLFQPMMIKLGGAYTLGGESHELETSIDISKYLVPTPPEKDASGNIVRGKDDNISVPAAIISSWGDAPGGFKEELQEMSFGVGLTYGYLHKFFLRTGMYYENPSKSSQRYMTFGVGLRLQSFYIDMAYRSGFGNQIQQQPGRQIFNLSIGLNVSAY